MKKFSILLICLFPEKYYLLKFIINFFLLRFEKCVYYYSRILAYNKFNDLIFRFGNRVDLFSGEMMIIISKEVSIN